MKGMFTRTLAASSIGVAMWVGCAASGTTSGDTTSGTGGTGGVATGGGPSGPGPGSGGSGGVEGCATFQAAAEQAPAAMLFVVDASASMSNGGKWQAAQLAVVSAIDQDAFDNISLGMVSFPLASPVTGPACILNLPVTCGYTALPQVPIGPTGTDKSNAGTGVRSQIYNYLTSNGPIIGTLGEDGSPIYDSMVAGYNALDLVPDVDKRILVLITDGGFSCTSLSNPQRQAFSDLNGCLDWEHPDTVNQLIVDKRDDADKPINTFIIGVPGSDSTGQQVGGYDTPPYSMLLALSTYAANGSPNTLEPCDSGLTFDQFGAAPNTPCHFDLSQGSLDAGALAEALSKIRGKALGCVYKLPEPPPGETISPDLVNVEITVDGTTSTLPRRSDPNDTCDNDGCWDYNADGDVELIGKACEDLSTAESASIEIVVGCQTVLK